MMLHPNSSAGIPRQEIGPELRPLLLTDYNYIFFKKKKLFAILHL
jgi:hypothetical protein